MTQACDETAWTTRRSGWWLMIARDRSCCCAVAVGVTVWRYGGAVDADHRALEESQVVVAAEQARTALARARRAGGRLRRRQGP